MSCIFSGRVAPPVIAYTDASFEPGVLPKFGWVLFQPGHNGCARAGTMSAYILSKFVQRDSHIFAAEIYAVFAFLVEHGPILRGRDLVLL